MSGLAPGLVWSGYDSDGASNDSVEENVMESSSPDRPMTQAQVGAPGAPRAAGG